MILLKKIQLINFLSHAKTEITFHPNEKILIDGLSGHGKSAIFEAILWALYGQGRVDNRALIYRGTKKVSVILELQKGEETVIITRSATSTGKHLLNITIKQKDGNGIALPLSGIRETQNWIDKELIGASYLLFINSAAYLQDNKESFVMQTAPRRKELLLEIVKAETYAKYYENARNALQLAQNEENLIKGRLISLEAQIAPLAARIELKQGFLSEVQENLKKLEEIKPQKVGLEVLKEKYIADSQTIGFLNNSISTTENEKIILEKKIETKQEKIKNKKNLQDELNSVPLVEQKLTNLHIQLEEAKIELKKVQTKEIEEKELLDRKPFVTPGILVEIGYLQKHIENINAQPKCPSGLDCPYSGDKTKQIEELNVKIKEYKAIAETEVIAFKSWELEWENKPKINVNATKQTVEGLEEEIFKGERERINLEFKQRELDSLKSIEIEISEITQEIFQKSFSLEHLKKQKEEAETTIKAYDINKIANGLLGIYEEERIMANKVSRAQAMVENIEQSEAELTTIQEQIQTLNTKDIKALQDRAYKIGLIKDAFSPKGIETMVIDYLLPKLEDQINKVLLRLSDFRVRLDTQRKSADGTGTIEGLFITIINEMGEEMPYEAYSGGEKMKITVAISEALASLQKVGFRLFDETFLGLDENSIDSFVKILYTLQINFNQVLCISHLPQIKDAFDKQIKVIKNKGISICLKN